MTTATTGPTAHAPQNALHGSFGVRAVRPISRLRAVILLAGVLRQTAFHTGVQRSLLDLPIDPGTNILTHWLDHATALATAADVRDLPLRVLLDRTSPQPQVPADPSRVRVQVERDSLEFRGTGGVLRDVATAYDDNDFLLVANGAQLVLDDLVELSGTLAQSEAGVAILSLPDQTPAGLMLIRCGALRDIPDIGFVDMKEQALPAIAKRHRVVVVRREVDRHPVRTMKDYLHALACRYRRRDTGVVCQDAFAEEWRSTFAIAENGSIVGPASVLHDSVVLRGATVGNGAVVVRSLVCSGAVVPAGQTIVDKLVT